MTESTRRIVSTMARAKTISRNGARYVVLSGLDMEANYQLLRRIVGPRLVNLVGIDVHTMRFRVY